MCDIHINQGLSASLAISTAVLWPRPKITLPAANMLTFRLTWIRRLRIIDGSFGGVPERSKGTDCKSVGSAFEGSNPSPSTIKMIGFGSRIRIGGGSLMVELQPSKLIARVRFPLAAPVAVGVGFNVVQTGFALVAQWQSTPLVRERSRVRSTPRAPFLMCI